MSSKKINKKRRWAIVGAGVSGSFLSSLLKEDSCNEVTLFEKSQGFGGRCAVRRHDLFGVFNHGANFFTNKNAKLEPYFRELKEGGLIETFPSLIGYCDYKGFFQKAERKNRFVGRPSMNSFVKNWAKEAHVKLNSEIYSLDYQDKKWNLKDKQGNFYSGFDSCVLSIPYPQGRVLWTKNSKLKLPETKFQSCWAVMLITDEQDCLYPAAFVKSKVISWYSSSRVSNKQRKWIIHGNSDWSDHNFDRDLEWVIKELSKGLAQLLKKNLKISYSSCHRWRYASNQIENQKAALWDKQKFFGYIGDWFLGGRVENAMASALYLYEALKN